MSYALALAATLAIPASVIVARQAVGVRPSGWHALGWLAILAVQQLVVGFTTPPAILSVGLTLVGFGVGALLVYDLWRVLDETIRVTDPVSRSL